MRTCSLPLSVLVPSAFCAGAPVGAQEPGAPPATCASASSQAALTACAAGQYRRADSALNATYQRALAAAGAARAPALRAAQRAWIPFRDAHCRYAAAAYAGGSAQGMAQSLCLATVTEARQRQLRESATPAGAGGGDPPPPGPAPVAVAGDAWAAAVARGVTFRAVGSEPGWTLEIVDGRRVTMVADYGQRRVVTPAPAPAVDSASGTRVYEIRTEAHRLTVRIDARRCQDAASGQDAPTAVTAVLDGRTYRGCGRPLR